MRAARARSTGSRSKIPAIAAGTACREVGFFYIAGHGVPDEKIVATHAAARAFLALPIDQRREIEATREHYRGYNLTGRERFSIPFFAHPDFDAVVACLPECQTPDRPAVCPPQHVGEFITQRFTANWATRLG